MSITVAAGLRALETLKLAAELEAAGTAPTEEQAAQLSSWTGWGILSPAFAPKPEGSWADISADLVDLLEPARFRDASTSLDVSFFTPPTLTEAVWSLLGAAGFKGGRVLEPGCGVGAFLSGAPRDLDISFHGIERDRTSAAIAAMIHPDATVTAASLQDVHLADGSFDAVIGNFPFASGHVYDKGGMYASSLHEYFLRRSLAALRPGGYLAVVTSTHFMDTESFTRMAEDGGQFVAAVRLPEEMFAATGATVVCDLILMRKAPEGQDGSAPAAGTSTVHGARINSWWTSHPELVVGEFEPTTFYQRPLTVKSGSLSAQLPPAIEAAAALAAASPMTAGNVIPALAASPEADGLKDGSYQVMVIDGTEQLVRITGGAAEPVVRPSKKLRALVELRDRVSALLEAESDTSAPDALLDPLRTAALMSYKAYVKAFGPINDGTLVEGKMDPETELPVMSWRPVNLAGFRSDPDFHLVSAIEVYDQETGESRPAPILLRRINKAPVPVTSAQTPAEALSITLGESGSLDLARVAGLLGLGSTGEAVAALGDLIYADPDAAGRWITARDYLCGNVREKLSNALAAAALDPAYERNVAALADVVPSDLGASDIRVSLGVPWVKAEDYENFAKEILGAAWLHIQHSRETAAWELDGHMQYGHTAAVDYGVPALDPLKLLGLGMNNKAPVVKVYDFRAGREIRDAAATSAAQEKLEAIRSAFAVWIWEDAARAERITGEYNRRFRSHVARTSDGSYLQFPTMDPGVDPYWWQRNIVDRIISSEAVLCGHVVGAGKTLSMAMAAVALRQYGLANKPAIIVPNHLLEQISREMSQAFPLGKFLIATKDDLTKERRRSFAARCATGDWDAVVMTHGAFTSLPVHPEVEKAWIQEQVEDLRSALFTGNGQSFSSRQISKKLRSYEAKLEKMRTNARKDEDQVFFEQLGIDYLAIDEAHYMKRLDVGSRMDGFSMGASKRATDLLLKSSWLRRTRPGKPVLGLFTGTPLTNSLVEIFVWQTFLQPDVLAEAGLSDFNAWAANFVHFRTVVEISPEGGSYRTKTRPVSILNAPELHTMFSLNADLLTADDISLPRPDADVRQRAVQQGAGQRAFTDHLVLRADKLRRGGGTDNDNMLAVVGDGRRSALDPRLVGVEEDSPKIAAVVEEIVRIDRENSDRLYGGAGTPGALQVAFCDQGTPSAAKGSQTYGRIRAALIAAGIPAGKIRWIHEATDDKSRAALFATCRDGSVSVLLGSTEKLGTGTNIQLRLAAIHHVDAPWRPSDIEQRDGRALRPGNLNTSVELHRYVVEGTFDAYQWQLLETKAISFLAMTSGSGPAAREVADISEVAPSYTQMKALAAGDPRLQRQAEVSDVIARLSNLRAVDRQGVNAARRDIPSLRKKAQSCRHDAEGIRTALEDLRQPSEKDLAPLGNILGWAREAMVGSNRHTTYGYGGARLDMACGSLRLVLSVDAENPYAVDFTLDRGYRTVNKSQIIIRKLGRNPQKAAAMARELALEMVEGLPARAAVLLDRAKDADARADAAELMVENYRFARQDELQAAQDELDRINRELEYAAEAEAAA